MLIEESRSEIKGYQLISGMAQKVFSEHALLEHTKFIIEMERLMLRTSTVSC